MHAKRTRQRLTEPTLPQFFERAVHDGYFALMLLRPRMPDHSAPAVHDYNR